MKKPLVIVWMGCLIFSLCAGCVTDVPQEKSDGSGPMVRATITENSHPEFPSIIPDGNVNSTSVSPSLFWIKIDPIGDHNAGDRFTISGTTNLNVSGKMLVEVYPMWWTDVMKRSQCGGAEIAGASATGTISPIMGYNIPNKWNFTVDSSTFPVQEYFVRIAAFDDATFDESAVAETQFYINGTSSEILSGQRCRK